MGIYMQTMKSTHIFFLAMIFFSSCGGQNTPSKVEAPGGEKTAKDRVLETGADILQDKSPLSRFNTYLDGFHFYNGNPKAQMEAYHRTDRYILIW